MKLMVRYDGREEEVHVERREERIAVTVGDREYLVDARRSGGDRRSLLVDGAQHEVAVHSLGNGTYRVATSQAAEEVEVLDPLTYLSRVGSGSAAGGGPRRIDAYMPGRVVALLVEEGAEVTSGQGVLVLEAMKMENEIQAEGDGVVRRLLVEEGQAVEGGDPLFEIE
jgi:biotin carboxyl carrier protein